MILIVANSLAPFAYECVQILGLPDGSHFRARFPKRWVEPKLLNRPLDLVGADGIIALRTWDNDNIHPLRRIKINAVRQAGEILFLTYSLGRLLSYSTTQAEQEMQINGSSTAVRNHLTYITDGRSAANSEMYPLVFDIEEQAFLNDFHEANQTSPDPETNWITLVGLLGSNAIFGGVPFFRIFFRRLGAKHAYNLTDGVLRIESGQTYEVETIYLLGEEGGPALTQEGSRTPTTPYMAAGPYELVAHSDNENVEFSPKIQPLSGRYDAFRLSFRAAGNGNFIDVLRFRFTVPDHVSSAFRPVMDVPVKFSRSWGGLALRIILVACLGLLWGLLNFQDDLRGFLSEKLSDFFAQFGMVFFALSCVELTKYVRDLWVGK